MTTMHHAALVVLWILLGSCFGSFLNVCIYRIPRGMSVLRPRSRCPRCGTAIRSRHNIPVLGWLMLGGRCRECRGPISVRYPAVELGVGLAFATPYLVAARLCGGDPSERLGSGWLLGLLLASWSVVGLGVVATGLGLEAKGRFTAHRAGDRRRAEAGSVGPGASALRSLADRG